jgi:hypothetical protein
LPSTSFTVKLRTDDWLITELEESEELTEKEFVVFVTEIQPAKIRLDRNSRKIFFIRKSFLLNKTNNILEKTCQNTQTDDEEQVARDLFGPAKILPFVFEKFQNLLGEKGHQKKGKDKA